MTRQKNVTDLQGRLVAFTYRFHDPSTQTDYQYMPVCPLCGGNHLHGHAEGGTGIRAAHCISEDKEYRLVCLGGMPKAIQKHFWKRHDWGADDAAG